MKKNPKLFLSRIMAGAVWKQIAMAVILLIMAYLIVWALYCFRC